MVKNFLRILICPLDWGIGHATRCVPVIRYLREMKHKVIIAGDGRPLEFLRAAFPDLEVVRFPGFRVSYPTGNNMFLKMFLQSPSIFINIYKEHRKLKKLIRDYQIDAIISDNRFGLWSKQAYSVYITHQMMIKAPAKMRWAETLLLYLHAWFIRHYDECWIPDLPGELNLSGDLSHRNTFPQNGNYVGILSRFEPENTPEVNAGHFAPPDLLVMLSGPEPQRSILEKLVLQELSLHRGLNAVLLQGIPGSQQRYSPQPGVTVISHLPDIEMMQLIIHSRLIVCRPGYSTIMDLAALGRNAILVPTPGQTEQEYLARHLTSKGWFQSIDQSGFNLSKVLEAGRFLHPLPDFRNDRSLLANRINGLPERVNAI